MPRPRVSGKAVCPSPSLSFPMLGVAAVSAPGPPFLPMLVALALATVLICVWREPPAPPHLGSPIPIQNIWELGWGGSFPGSCCLRPCDGGGDGECLGLPRMGPRCARAQTHLGSRPSAGKAARCIRAWAGEASDNRPRWGSASPAAVA